MNRYTVRLETRKSVFENWIIRRVVRIYAKNPELAKFHGLRKIFKKSPDLRNNQMVRISVSKADGFRKEFYIHPEH